MVVPLTLMTVLRKVLAQRTEELDEKTLSEALCSGDKMTIKEYYPGERGGLLLLRDSVSSTKNLHSNWTGPPCNNNSSRWFGVACSNWHVVGLVLEDIRLTGSLPPEFLQNITFLTRISFRNNSVSGELPDLTNLVHLKYVLFSSNRLAGLIPSEYTQLLRLRQLELQENQLTGSVPPFDQQSLTAFNLSYNQLGGQIPDTDVLQRFPRSSYEHNSNLCGSPLTACPISPAPASPSPTPPLPSPTKPRDKGSKLKAWHIVLIASAAALVPFVVMFFFLQRRRKARRKESRKERQAGARSAGMQGNIAPHSHSIDDPERTVELEFLDRSTPVFDLDDLLTSSAEVLGKGRLGTTYKAALESGIVVAVKRVRNMSGLSKKEFIQQMQLLGRMRHDNLVKIVSFYFSKEEKLVMYEFVPDGNLFDLLHWNRGVGRTPLSWAARLSIIKDVANGLAFLHQSLPSHKVPHANLKSSNVLIHLEGEAYRAKLSDYGFLPLLPSERSSQRVAICRSPEFCRERRLTHKADVYCFGIVLLEVITGKIPDDVTSTNNADRVDSLSEWVREVVNQDWSTDIFDLEIVAAREGHNDMIGLTELALQCTDEAPERRPKMIEVVNKIEEFEQRSVHHDD